MCASSANMLTFEKEDQILALPSSLLNATQLFRTLHMLHHVSHPFVLPVNPGAPFLSHSSLIHVCAWSVPMNHRAGDEEGTAGVQLWASS